MQFMAQVTLDGKTATGIPVPEEIISALGGGNRPRVRVTVAGHTYQTTVARMHGEFKFPVSAAVREQAGLSAGDDVEVAIALDDTPRTINVPDDLAAALEACPGGRQAFDRLSYSSRKRHVLAVEGAKTRETRRRRVEKVVSELLASAE